MTKKIRLQAPFGDLGCQRPGLQSTEPNTEAAPNNAAIAAAITPVIYISDLPPVSGGTCHFYSFNGSRRSGIFVYSSTYRRSKQEDTFLSFSG